MSKLQTYVETLSDPFRLELLRAVKSGELESVLNPAPIQNYTLYPKQTPPEGDWFIHFFMAGRGAGKSFALAHWIKQKAFENPGCRIALVGRSIPETRHLIDRIIDLHDPSQTPKFTAHNSTITWYNGSTVEVFASLFPNDLRGKQFHFGAGTEFTRWKTDGCSYGPKAYQELQCSVRLGENPQIYLEGPPFPGPHVRDLLERSQDPQSRVVATRSNLFKNPSMSHSYIENLLRAYGNTDQVNTEILGDYEDEYGVL